MAQTLSLSSEVRVFSCPKCGQTINTSMENCAFCAQPINHESAERAASATSTVSQAVSDASYLRILMGVAFAFIFLRFVPFVGIIGIFGFPFLELAIPFLTIRWWVRFRSVRTDDLDFAPAKRTVLFVSVGLVLFFILRFSGVVVIKPI